MTKFISAVFRSLFRVRVIVLLLLAMGAAYIYTHLSLTAFGGKTHELGTIMHVEGHQYFAHLPKGTPSSHIGPLNAYLCESRQGGINPPGVLDFYLGDYRVYAWLAERIKLRFYDTTVTILDCRDDHGNAQHVEIGSYGGGRFSVWHDVLRFASFDNTDPRNNGRQYSLILPSRASQYVQAYALPCALLLGFLLLVRLATRRAAFAESARFVLRNSLVRNTVPGLLITLIMVGGMVVGAEFYLRSLTPFDKSVWPGQFDPQFGFNFQPDAEIRHTNNSDFWTINHSNSIGFLDREPAMPKPDGVFRIMVIGDSFVEAAQVKIRDKFQVLLEDRLDGFMDRDFDTVALGYSGTGQINQLPFYETFAPRLDPDLVILLVVGNDISNNSAVLEAIRTGWHPDHPPRLFFKLEDNGASYSRVPIDPDWGKYHWPVEPQLHVREKYAARLAWLRGLPEFAPGFDGWDFPDDGDVDTVLFAEDLPPAFADAVRMTELGFQAWRETVDRDGVKILAVLTEGVTRKGRDWNEANGRLASGQNYRKKIERAAALANIPVLDLHPIFDDYTDGDLDKTHFLYDSHWAESGHRWAAQAISEYLMNHPDLLQP